MSHAVNRQADPFEEEPYEEEEIIEEVVDGGSEDEYEETPADSVAHSTPTKQPGRVVPSSAVASMKIQSPETALKSPAVGIRPDKNPFPTYGAWTADTLSQIDIVFPTLTGRDESTNELTRANRPDNRYWKSKITFKYSTYSSETIRIDNVAVPYHGADKYGSSFVYLCLPGIFATAFQEAGKSKRPTVVTEPSLVPDTNRWWKVANKVDNTFGVISSDTKKFQAKSLVTIFDSTRLGITANVDLKFVCKASTDEQQALKPTTSCTVAVEVVRAYITGVGVDVQGPVRKKSVRPKIEPVAKPGDVANDELMKKLKDMGL